MINKFRAYNRILLVFNHGLGDVINFIPVFEELQKQLGKRVFIGADSKRGIHLIDKRFIELTEDTDYRSRYDFVYRVFYPEPKTAMVPPEFNTEAAKPYLCAYYELGMEPFVWKPAKLQNPVFDSESKRVGVHFFGHSSCAVKCVPKESCELIWEEIKEAGYDPFEIHMKTQFAKDYTSYIENVDDFKYASEDNSLRFQEPNLKIMYEEMGRCRFFLGVDSGPLYLSSAILGPDRIIGLEKNKFVNNYLPVHINTVNVKEYQKGEITRLLKIMEGNLANLAK